MNIEGKTIWQQAAGDTNRDYADICLRWDVILNGPGEEGPWPDCASALAWCSSRKITDLRRFCEEIKDGDLVVLRIGTATVVAVGEIVGNYEWREEFGDVDGWCLQHVRRVRWLRDLTTQPMIFDTYALKLGDTTQRLNIGPVTEWLASLEVSQEAVTRPLVDLPAPGSCCEISVQELSEHLFDFGVSSASISNLVAEMGELVRISNWYRRSNNNPSEYETISYLVAPLLRGLGWTPQRMAIEWNNVDVALFDSLPRENSSLTAVVEAKRMNRSCLTAASQAEEYSRGKAGCHRLIVTDGLRYGVYLRNESGQFKLYAYMNLTDLRSQYPIHECKGAKDAMHTMSPEWRPSVPR